MHRILKSLKVTTLKVNLVLALVPALAHAQTANPAEPVPGDAPVTTPVPTPVTTPVVVAEPVKPADAPKPSVLSKFQTQFYGFVEQDSIYDSTQSLSDGPGNAFISRNGTNAGQKGRLQFSIRNSRLGYKIAAPAMGSVKISGIAEMDFLGNQPDSAVDKSGNPAVSEAAVWNNPGLRARHLLLKVENPIVDIWFGQTWNLFGGQPIVHPNSVQIQGLLGQVYSRTTQIRLLHTFKTEPLNVEVAVALARPPQKEAAMPDLQGALKFQLNNWKGLHTSGSTGTGVDPLTVSLSGIYRSFEMSTDPTTSTVVNGWGVSVDALIPVLPGSLDDRSNSLTLTASYAMGAGIADMYSGMKTGVGIPTASIPGSPAPASLDANLVGLDPKTKAPSAVKLQSMIFGLQYYLPGGGKWWLAANYGSLASDNAKDLVASAKGALKSAMFWDACLFWDAAEGLRIGAEFAQTKTTYGDDGVATNNRAQLSAFYLF